MKQIVKQLISTAVTVSALHAEQEFIFMRKDTIVSGKDIVPCVIQGDHRTKVCTACGARCKPCRHSRDQKFNAGCQRCNACSGHKSVSKERLAKLCHSPQFSSKECTTLCNTVRSIFIPRSQGADTARELVGWQELIHRCTGGKNYAVFASSLGYSRSFEPERIARYFFGENTLFFAGSQIKDRGNRELLADNFGLSPTFRGRLNVSPVIDNVFFDMQAFVGLDAWICGLYFRAHAPVVHTRWDLRARACREDRGACAPFPACYMGSQQARATCDILKALSGSFTFGALQERLQFGKFAGHTLAKTGLANIDLIVGWDFLKCDMYHLGIFGLVVAPTGNKPTGRFIFEPIVGNGKRLEVGAGISGHLILWEDGPLQSLGIYLEGNITHMFKSRQVRSFDFCNQGPLSRYMLLKEFKRVDDSIVPTGKILNGINFTSRCVDVSVPIRGDVSVKLAYRGGCITADLGYNFYGNAQEKVKFCKKENDGRLFGIKGTAGTCALEYRVEGTEQPLSFGPLVRKIPLNATESHATIDHGAHIDNAQAVPAVSPQTIVVTALSKQSGILVGPGVQKAQSSQPPILVSEKDFNIRSGSAGPTATHKVFGYVGYTFEPCNSWYVPYIGLGGELEIDALACNERTSLNQWSLWVKSGIEF